jgi:serine/threonine protein phosphatase PrpC
MLFFTSLLRGGECALYVADELPAKIVSYLRSGVEGPEALFNSFLKIDQEFLKIGENVSGSTASVMLWDSYRLRASFANTGDTRAIISRNGLAYDLTLDRKATDHDEIARIVRDGGLVQNGRVQGSLAVSRAFGDRRLKELNRGEKRVLVVDPDVSTFQLIPDIDEFIVIATDGLWDVLSSQQVVDYVKSNLLTKGFDISQKLRCSASELTLALNEVADSLVKHAIFDLSSGDNVTAMIIVLDNCRNIKLNSNTSTATDAGSSKVGELAINSSVSSAPSSVFRGRSTSSTATYTNNSNSSNAVDSSFNSSSTGRSIEPQSSKLVGLKPSTAAPIASSMNSSTPSSASSSKGTKVKNKSETDDDLMDFLMDDRNF